MKKAWKYAAWRREFIEIYILRKFDGRPFRQVNGKAWQRGKSRLQHGLGGLDGEENGGEED